jgi:NAD(P)H-nitrite reductase large subunit
MALICHCNGVRDHAIVTAIRCGARSLEDVQSACGATAGCFGCAPAVQELLAAHAAEHGSALELSA